MAVCKKFYILLLVVTAGCDSRGRDKGSDAGADAGTGDVAEIDEDAGARRDDADAGDVDGGVDDVDAGAAEDEAEEGGHAGDAGDVVDAGDEDAGGVDSGEGGTTSLPPCPTYAGGEAGGFLLNLSVREASGVIEGRVNSGILWTHEDSGSEPHVYAMTTTGRPRGTYILDGADAIDWEDIAAGPGADPATSALYVADIGDNGASRRACRCTA
jgi:hypothetical protein